MRGTVTRDGDYVRVQGGSNLRACHGVAVSGFWEKRVQSAGLETPGRDPGRQPGVDRRQTARCRQKTR